MELKSREGELLFTYEGTLVETLAAAKRASTNLDRLCLSGQDMKNMEINIAGTLYLKDCTLQDCSIIADKVFLSGCQIEKMKVEADKISIGMSYAANIQIASGNLRFSNSTIRGAEIEGKRITLKAIDSLIRNIEIKNCVLILNVQGSTFYNLQAFNVMAQGICNDTTIIASKFTYLDCWHLDANSLVVKDTFMENLVIRHSDVRKSYILNCMINYEIGRNVFLAVEKTDSVLNRNKK